MPLSGEPVRLFVYIRIPRSRRGMFLDVSLKKHGIAKKYLEKFFQTCYNKME